MSEIKKALEKAKAQRIPFEGIDTYVEVKGAPEIEPPKYTVTRVIEPPTSVFRKNRIVSVEDDHPIADHFKLLRTRVINSTRVENKNTIQITGFKPNEGKTLVAANLAICIARDTRHTTLLVDMDFRKPSIHKILGLGEQVKGLKDYFNGEATLEELFINPGIEKLTVLTAGGSLKNSTEIMGSSRMESLVKELKRRYPERYIIFDTPGINTCPDPVVFAEYVDAILLVARYDHTTTDSVEAAIELIPREKVIGTVLNDSKWLDSPGYYYKHYY